MPFRNRQTVPPSDTEVRRVNAPALADLGSIPRLQRFECNGRSRRLSRRVFLELTPDDRATPQRSSRTVFGADNLWVCAKASPNPLEKLHRQTRGFTSCPPSHTILGRGPNAPFWPEFENLLAQESFTMSASLTLNRCYSHLRQAPSTTLRAQQHRPAVDSGVSPAGKKLLICPRNLVLQYCFTDKPRSDTPTAVKISSFWQNSLFLNDRSNDRDHIVFFPPFATVARRNIP